jgi:hypothetical protein
MSDSDEPEARPDWLPVNFQTPEAMVESWRSSQAALTQTRQQLRAYEKENESEILADAQTPTHVADDRAELLLGISQEQLAATFDPATEGLRMLSAKYPDLPSKLPHMQQVMRDQPDLIPRAALVSPDLAAGAYEVVYNLVSSADIVATAATKAGELASQAAALQVEARRQMKLNAQTLHGANGRPSPVEVSKFDEIMNVPTLNATNMFG